MAAVNPGNSAAHSGRPIGNTAQGSISAAFFALGKGSAKEWNGQQRKGQGKGMDWQQRKGSISAAFFALGKGSAAAVNPAAHCGRPTLLLPAAVLCRRSMLPWAREWIGSSSAAAADMPE